MRKTSKHIVLLFCSVILITVIVGVFLAEDNTHELFKIVVGGSTGEEIITYWENDRSQIYVFLPAYVEMKNVRLLMQMNTEMRINGELLDADVRCNRFSLDVQYDLSYDFFGTEKKKTLTFVRSDDIPVMYVTTESGSNMYIKEDKNHSEQAEISVYTSNGEINYLNENFTISGRGNYTWENFDKKPYNIFLPEPADLLNMGKGNGWVLLANADDASHMRNRIVYDFAERVGMPYSPESCWITLYLNGEYQGLYLLCEQIEVSEERVNISQTEGAILALERRSKLEESNDVFFITEADVAVEICVPELIDEYYKSVLQESIQSVENAILSENGVDSVSGRKLEELIDLESWAKKYLLEEVFGNHDAGFTSQFFYYTDVADKLYAGPVWDFDLALGNESAWQLREPNSLFANRPVAEAGMATPWFYELYQQNAFYTELVQQYKYIFLQELDYMFDVMIYDYVDLIAQAAVIDAIRWRYGDYDLMIHTEAIRSYMQDRMDFLTSLWCEDQQYCVVRARQQFGGYYAYYMVKYGQTLEELPDFSDTDESVFLGWYYEETDEPFDMSRPVIEDTQICTKWANNPKSILLKVAKIAPICIFLGILVIVFGVNMKLRKIGKSKWKK